MKTILTVAGLSLLLWAPSTAFAGIADTYVKGLQGKWRGGGTVRVDRKGTKVRLRCSANNTLNKANRTLSIRGKCASTQGTRNLRGTIRYSGDGRTITGASLRLGKQAGSVSAKFRGKSLLLFGTAKAPDGKSVKTRSTIRGGGSRFSISLSANEGNGYRPVGTLTFRK